MGVGLPMAASDIPPVAELVRDNETALLVPPRDATALAAAIERLLLDPDLARLLAANAKAAAAQHDWQATARAYEAVYDRALGVRT
jgi:glycosyltransferase involved in cell wall biosynthesis